MKNIVVVGAQWGDEGKGKVVDLLTPHFDIVARYQGGHNAGHTVRIGDKKFVLHLIPSGILHPECTCVIGNGVVIDPSAFITELAELEKADIQINGRLHISARAHLITPYHTAIERIHEERLGVRCVGTTMRGIGPAYEDKVARAGIRAGDVLHYEVLRARFQENVEYANILLKITGADLLDGGALLDEYMKTASLLAPFIEDTTSLINNAVRNGKSLLLEGAQGTMLDVDFGTYPYVTSSSSTAGGAAIGTGLPPKWITGALGIAKAYTTRVGSGPFPTELNDDAGKYIRDRGNEYGASTGRPRRTGWFDAVVVRYSTMLNGLDALALPKLDVLDEFDEIKICSSYRYRGMLIYEMPYGAEALEECEPVYETVPGWKRATKGITDYDDLPEAAKAYIRRLEELSGAPIAIISTGPERNETIIRKDSIVAHWTA